MIVAGRIGRRQLNIVIQDLPYGIFVANYMKHYDQQEINRKFINCENLHFCVKYTTFMSVNTVCDADECASSFISARQHML